MKVKVAQTTALQINYLVAKCEGWDSIGLAEIISGEAYPDLHAFTTDWAQGGPIIEREGISTVFCSGDLGEPRNYWIATAEAQGWEWGYGPYHAQDDEKSIQIYKATTHTGPTPLIAAMRCYVASQMGDEVEIPDELV